MGKLSSLFTGATTAFSPLSSAVGVCHIFNLLLAHVNRTRTNDGGGDLEHGAFWRRHREIDNLLLSGFMSLPTCQSRSGGGGYHGLQTSHLDWRLGRPMHVRLNLHASVICLHMAAVDRAEAHGLAPDIKRSSHARVLMSAHEIVKITRAVAASSPPPSSTMTTYQHRTPLAALALYCAAMVYMMLIKDSEGSRSGDNNNNASSSSSSSSSSSASSSPELWPGCRENLEYIVRRTEAVSGAHPVARAFLLQLVLDLEHHGIRSAVSVSAAELQGVPRFTHKIPILVRTAASRRAEDAQGSSPSSSARLSSEWLPFVRPLGCAKSTSRQWAVGSGSGSGGHGPGFVEDDGGDVSVGTTTTTTTAAVAATPSTAVPPPFSLANGNHVGGKRRRVDGRQSRSPQAATTVLPHRSSPLDSGGGDGLGNVGSGLDAYCNPRDDAGPAWTEADMDALVREFVQVDGRASELGYGQGATGNDDASASAQTASNGSQPWGAFNF